MLCRSFRKLLLPAVLVCTAWPASAAPANNLDAEARTSAAKHLREMGKGYTAHVDSRRRLVYVSALDPEHLRRTRELLSAYVDAQARTLFVKPLPWNLTILLPTPKDYRKLAAKAGMKGSLGYCAANGRKLVSIDRGSVLIHEFTHALHAGDVTPVRQKHPIWVKEGLASLFESCRIAPGGLEPYVATRLPGLQAAIRKKTVVPLKRLLTMGPKPFMKQAHLCYAQARYLMLYLHRRGRLKSWYRDYKRTYTADPSGRKALEGALGFPLSQIEPQWHQWVAKLRMPRGTRRNAQARLGAAVVNHPRGVKIVSLVPDGPAKRAGRLKVGDVILRINGLKTGNPAAFVAVVRGAGANRTVRIDVLRRGHEQTVLQPLGAPRAIARGEKPTR